MSRAIFLVALVSLACSRSLPESQGRDVATGVPHEAPRAAPPAAAPHTLDKTPAPASGTATVGEPDAAPFRFAAAERVVAIGDLHGDLASAREALRLAGAIDAEDRWSGGKLVLVQVGDQLDRGDDEPEILRLLERLTEEAAASGGAVHVLNGNHELMNAVGDLRYVTADGMRDYADAPLPSKAMFPADFPAQARGRYAAFAPGSELARTLAKRNTILVVGDTVFAHAGVLPKHVTYGVARINEEVSRFLRGESPHLPEIAASEDAPVWTRVFGEPSPTADACRDLTSVLDALSVKRMVVGHTVQQAGVTSACGDRVYRVDVGLSDYYGNNTTQVLELTSSGAKVLGARAVGGSR